MSKDKIKVLIADDQEVTREGLKTMLEPATDMEVIGEALSALETFRKVIELSPDVILMDLKWFGDETAGWTAIREIKSSHPGKRIIAITAFSRLIKEARRAGADAAILKTFTREELLKLIRELVLTDTDFKAPNQSDNPIDDLTPREQDVLILIAQSSTNKEIAQALHISESTAKNHVKSILSKFNAKNRLQAANIAREYKFVS